MFKGKKIISCLFFIFMLLPAVVQAGETADLKKKIMFDQKKLIVMENMKFTDDEAKFFWPVFGDLQKELFEIDQRAAKLIVAYAASYQTLTDDQAAKIVDEYFAIHNKRLAILGTYMKKLTKGLPAKKVFRYLQVENKLAAIARYELAKGIPLAN
jgi:hypothetical protein